ncbi:MAG TPA: hypothetical protein VM510_12545 [Caulifigura sp.]|nr:hypothetical protein [Caulifigura sp.]
MNGRRIGLALVLALVAAFAQAQDNPYAENYFRMLTDRGIATDAEGLRNFLLSHIPGPEDTARLKQQLADLGHEEYARREAAMQALLARPPRSLDDLDKLSTSNDPEVRWRAKLVVDSLRQPGNDLLYASLIVISSRKIQGLADVVLGVAPNCQSESMQLAMSRALMATATARDAEVLRKNLKSEDLHVRIACLNALLTSVGEAGVGDVLPLLDDASDLVRFDAASQLLKFRRPESLRTLGKLLTSDQLTVRNRSIHALRSNLKVSLPYSGYEPPEDRARHAAEWQKTIEANLDEKPATTSSSTTADGFVARLALNLPQHKTLLLIGKDGSVQSRALSQDGTRVTALDGGHLLAVHPADRVVSETTDVDKVVWKSTTLDERPILAVRRKDGMTQVATMEGSLIDVTGGGDMVRKSDIGVVVDIEALPNSETLLLSFADRLVKQIDANGRPKWQAAVPAPPTSMCLTSDGHALITLQGLPQMMDVDLATKEMKPLPCPFRSPTQIEQAADGRIVIVDAVGAHYADRQGTLIETIKLFPGGPSGT